MQSKILGKFQSYMTHESNLERKQIQKKKFQVKIKVTSFRIRQSHCTVQNSARHWQKRRRKWEDGFLFDLVLVFSSRKCGEEKPQCLSITSDGISFFFFSSFSFLNCHFGFVVKLNIADFLLYDSSLDKNSRK